MHKLIEIANKSPEELKVTLKRLEDGTPYIPASERVRVARANGVDYEISHNHVTEHNNIIVKSTVMVYLQNGQSRVYDDVSRQSINDPDGYEKAYTISTSRALKNAGILAGDIVTMEEVLKKDIRERVVTPSNTKDTVGAAVRHLAEKTNKQTTVKESNVTETPVAIPEKENDDPIQESGEKAIEDEIEASEEFAAEVREEAKQRPLKGKEILPEDMNTRRRFAAGLIHPDGVTNKSFFIKLNDLGPARAINKLKQVQEDYQLNYTLSDILALSNDVRQELADYLKVPYKGWQKMTDKFKRETMSDMIMAWVNGGFEELMKNLYPTKWDKVMEEYSKEREVLDKPPISDKNVQVDMPFESSEMEAAEAAFEEDGLPDGAVDESDELEEVSDLGEDGRRDESNGTNIYSIVANYGLTFEDDIDPICEDLGITRCHDLSDWVCTIPKAEVIVLIDALKKL